MLHGKGANGPGGRKSARSQFKPCHRIHSNHRMAAMTEKKKKKAMSKKKKAEKKPADAK